jgi:prepilin-type N-terminal cleavage/methylation domain-containing protein
MKIIVRLQGYTLLEMSIATGIIGIVGLGIYSLLSINTVLGAKNTAVNAAHQQARTAMMQMLQDLHSSISLPSLIDVNGNTVAGAGPAAGIAFQEWSSGPHQISTDAATTQNQITLNLTAGSGPTPVVGQRLIVPTHQIEDDITGVSGTSNAFTVTLAHNLPVAITGTDSYTIVAFISDRCSYTIASGSLKWQGPTTRKSFAVLGNDITSPTPFSLPLTPAGALYYRFVSAINLSTADPTYSNRGFKAANIFLNGQVPMKARLTTYQ